MKTLCVTSYLLFSLAAWGQVDFADNTNSFIKSASDQFPEVDVNKITWAAWMFNDSQPAGVDYVYTASLTDGTGAKFYVRVEDELSGSYSLNFWRVWTTGTGNWSSVDLNITGWNHLLVTYDDSSSTNDPVFYLNGTSQSKGLDTNPSGSPETGADTVMIGTRQDNSFVGRYTAHLYHMSVWNGILNAGERQALVNGVSPLKVRTPNLIGYWPLYGAKKGEAHFNSAYLSEGSTISTSSQSPFPFIQLPVF